MSAEIRRVPAHWEHPKYHFYNNITRASEIRLRPLHSGGLENYEEYVKDWKKELREWYKGWKLWESGYYEHWEDGKIPIEQAVADMLTSWGEEDTLDYHTSERVALENGDFSYETYAGEPPSPPNPYDFMPEGKWYQLFESVSEGTPRSPAFKTPQELIEWLVNNKDYWDEQWTREQAEAIIKDEYAPSMVVVDGKIYNDRESLLLDKS